LGTFPSRQLSLSITRGPKMRIDNVIVAAPNYATVR